MGPKSQGKAKPSAVTARRQAPRPLSPLFAPLTFDESAVVQAKCACGGGCPGCQDEFKIQTKLTVSEPDDLYEQEADQVADEVMRMPDTAAPAAPSVNVTPVVQRTEETEPEEEEPEEAVQMAAAPGTAASPPDEPPLEASLESMRGRGAPLPLAERTYFEQRFGRDFGGVRVHVGGHADRTARNARALAFASGGDLVFRSGYYAPHTAAGRRLLAHELTHVVQQGRAPPLASPRSSASPQARAPPSATTASPLTGNGAATPGRDLRVYRVPTGGVTLIQRTCAVNMAQVAAQNALAAVAGKYRPVHMGPTFGTAIHVKLLEKLRAANPDLVTEAPIPGTNKKTPGHDLMGEADLYMADPARTVSGIRGVAGTANPPEYEGTLGCGVEPKTVPRSPKLVPGASQFTGKFVTSFWVGDLKPASRQEVRGGNRQLSNYKDHHKTWAATAIKANKTGDTSDAPPNGNLLPEGDGSNHTVKIPDELSYKKFATQKSSAGGLHEKTERLWLFHLPNHPGIYLYFDLPATFTDQDIAPRLKALDEHLIKMNKPMTTKPTPISNVGGIAQPKAEPSRPRPPPRTLLRKHSSRRIARQAYGIRSRLVQRSMPPADLADWKMEQKKWTADVEKLSKENTGTVPKLYFDDIFGLTTGTAQGSAKLLGKLDLWAGASGTILGTLGWKFRKVLAKFQPFFDKIKAKFKGFRTKLEGFKGSKGGRWFVIVFQTLLALGKVVFRKLLDHAYKMLANCVNGMIDGAFGEVMTWFQSLDEVKELEEEALKPINQVVQQFEEWEQKAKDLFKDLETQFETFFTFMKESEEILKIVRTVEPTLRIILQLISCGSPPAWGCLWGIVGQVAFDTALTLGMKYIKDTKVYQDTMNDLACTAVKGKLESWYGGLLRTLVETVGLAEFADKVKAPCKFDPAESNFKCDLPSSGVSPEQRHGQATGDQELMDQMKTEALPSIDLTPGNPATESQVQQFLDTAKGTGVSVDQFKMCVVKVNDRVILSDALPCILKPPPSPPPPSVAGGGKGGGGKGGGQKGGGQSGGGESQGDSSMTDQADQDQGGSSGGSPGGASGGAGGKSPGSPPSGGTPPSPEEEGGGKSGGGQAQGGGSAGGAAAPGGGLSDDARETAEGLIHQMLEQMDPEGDDAQRLRNLRDSLKKGASEETSQEPLSQASEMDEEEVALVQAKCACGGGCPTCQEGDLDVQTRLAFSSLGDPYEHEADRVADEVLLGSAAAIGPSISRVIQRQTMSAPCGASRSGSDNALAAVRNGGQPLPAPDRQYFEDRFGRDFSGVRVHHTTRADQAARGLHALAYTTGADIAFRSGQYSPGSASGRRLLAHELAHVVQQRAAGSGPARIQRACRTAGIGSPVGCTAHDPVFLEGYPAYRFNPDCDDFASGQLAKLVKDVAALGAGAEFEVHGYASRGGDAAFNRNLSCARALKAQTALTDAAPAGAGISAAKIVGVFSHGGTPGPFFQRAAVLIAPRRPAGLPAALPVAGAGDFQINQVSTSTTSKVFFAGGSSALDAGAATAINSLKKSAPGSVKLIGFASGDEPASLAQDRADEVKKVLTAAPDAVTVTSAVGNAGATEKRSEFAAVRSVEILPAAATPITVDCKEKDLAGVLVHPPTEPCSAMDPPTETAFTDAMPISNDAMKRAVDAVAPASVAKKIALIDKFFGNHSASTLTTLRRNLAKLKKHVEDLPKSARCGHGQCDAGGCEQGSIAYNNNVDAASTMTICVPKFKGLHINDRARNLIHESAHGTTPLGGPVAPTKGTRDVAYRHERMLLQLSPAERLRNSDSYALFAMFVRETEIKGDPAAVPVGFTTPASDLLPGFTGTEPDALKLALARLEKRLAWATDWSGQLYGQAADVKAGTIAWADSWAEELMRQAAVRFPLTPPPAAPTRTDLNRLAAILDRYTRMKRAVKRDLSLTRVAADGVNWTAAAGSSIASVSVEIGPEFFRAAPEDQVSLLLEQLAGGTKDVEVPFVPAYVSLAAWIHSQNP